MSQCLVYLHFPLHFRYIAKKVSEAIQCLTCRLLLVEPAAFRDFTYDDNHTQYKLIISKDKGGLTYPTNYTIKVAEAAERCVRQHTAHNKTNSLSLEYLQKSVLNQVGGPPADFEEHASDTRDGLSNHYYEILSKLVRKFYQVRQFHIAKRANLSIHPNKKRSKMTKTINFMGQ